MKRLHKDTGNVNVHSIKTIQCVANERTHSFGDIAVAKCEEIGHTIMPSIDEYVKKEINYMRKERGALFAMIAGGTLGYIGSDMFCAKLGITGTLSKCLLKFCGTIAGAVAGNNLGLVYLNCRLTAFLLLRHLLYWPL
ncbi:hypothetical protein DPMN_109290 [Dreissena polymorpha]|uniref:Uncharacterized protein n=1 Tax=Dreissena polymorpha TaxID=45954 RepID=A0A9D4QLT3_DREPO|nr:hypothetical protein DPMN_109290 [Dreissena polymorpha]